MTDAYDEAIAHLRQFEGNPEIFQKKIRHAWLSPADIFGGCLFDYTGGSFVDAGHSEFKSGFVQVGQSRHWCGCLTQVKQHHYMMFGPIEIGLVGGAEILERIVHDPRIPAHPPGADPAADDGLGNLADTTVESLVAFAEYQREIDKMLGRPAPFWDGGVYVRGLYDRQNT